MEYMSTHVSLNISECFFWAHHMTLFKHFLWWLKKSIFLSGTLINENTQIWLEPSVNLIKTVFYPRLIARLASYLYFIFLSALYCV